MQLMGGALDVEVVVLPGAGFCRQQRAVVVYAPLSGISSFASLSASSLSLAVVLDSSIVWTYPYWATA
jgi:hypothetical protein